VDGADVVQDTWIRWQGTDHNRVRDAAAFLATTTRRLTLNVAQSARVRRETSIDRWDPEPVDVQADPTLGVERREALELAMHMLTEKPPASTSPANLAGRSAAAEQQRFIDAFVYAVQSADLTTLEQLVAALGRPVQG
jgi:hypothetical protein